MLIIDAICLTAALLLFKVQATLLAMIANHRRNLTISICMSCFLRMITFDTINSKITCHILTRTLFCFRLACYKFWAFLILG